MSGMTKEELLKEFKSVAETEAKVQTENIKKEQADLIKASIDKHAELVTTKFATKESIDAVNVQLNEMTKKYSKSEADRIKIEEEKQKSEERIANLEIELSKMSSGEEVKKFMAMNELMPIVLKNANIKDCSNYAELKEKYLRSNVFDEGQAAMLISNPIIERELLNIAEIINYASVTTADTKILPVLVRMNERTYQTPGELGAVTADTSKFFRREARVVAERMQISIPVTLEIMDLQTIPGINVENDLQTDAAMALAQQIGEYLTNGTGLNQPLGIMKDDLVNTSINVTSVATFEFDSIAKMMDELSKPYRNNSAFMMNSKALTTLRCIKNGLGSPLFETDYKLATPITLYNKPVIINDEMDDVTTGSKSPIIFGNFRNFKVLKYSRVIMDVNKSTTDSGYYNFSFRTYLGSKVTDSNAFVKATIA